MRSCIHVGFVGGNGSRHRRTKSTESRHPSKKEKKISWNLTPRDEAPNNSACPAQTTPAEPLALIQNVVDRKLPQVPMSSPSPYVFSPSPFVTQFEARHLSPRNPRHYSYSTPASPSPSRKLPTPPAYQHSVLQPHFRY